MKFLICAGLASMLTACGTTPYEGNGPAGSERRDYSNSQMDCNRIARKMYPHGDISGALDKCSQDKTDTSAGG